MPYPTFEDVEKAQPLEVFDLISAFKEDSYSKKVDIGAGAYRDNEGKPWVLPVVRRTEIQIATNESINHEYLPVLGNVEFRKAATIFLLGPDSPAVKEKRAFGIQALSGSGSIRLGAEFLNQILCRKVFYYSEPTWENHHRIFVKSGFTSPRTYRYWDEEKRALDIDGLLADLEAAPSGAVIILHACAHNPTGCDPTPEQWIKIADVMERRQLFPFFDTAYQGFATGDPDRDAWAVRYFVERGFEILAGQSFAKNFGLYCERVGNLTVVQKSSSSTQAVLSQFTLLVRALYSSPPAYGSRIVATILNDEALRNEWLDCLRVMSSRIRKMREALHKGLVDRKTPGTWDHVISQIGLFSYTGLNKEQVRILVNDYHVYLLSSGRANICGINESNVDYLADAIHAVVTGSPKE